MVGVPVEYKSTEVGSTTSESDTGVSRSASADERLCNSSVAKSNPSSIVTQWTPPFRRLFLVVGVPVDTKTQKWVRLPAKILALFSVLRISRGTNIVMSSNVETSRLYFFTMLQQNQCRDFARQYANAEISPFR